MGEFDINALYEALDERRRARGLTWAEVTAEINAPFAEVPSTPISTGTIMSMCKKRSVTSAVILQILRWMGRPPESFLSGDTSVDEANALPAIPPTQVLRFDTAAMYAALNARRIERGMTWRQVASEMPWFTESMLTNLAKGPLIGFPRVMTISQWLRRPASDFMRGYDW